MPKNDKITYAFIDSQNLNLGIRNNIKSKDGKIIYKGWKLDFHKFRKYLTDKYQVSTAFLFIGEVPKYRNLYKHLKKCGFSIIFKPTLNKYSNGKTVTKGNVDCELVLYSSAKLINDFDDAIIVSGDGDFYCLYEYLIEKNKLKKILIPNKFSYSSLLREFPNKIDYISNKRKILEKEKGGY
jgi:uncharacterized LabA/DUF88 family protein